MATPQELLSASSCFRCLTDGQLDVVAVSLLSDISLNGGGGGGATTFANPSAQVGLTPVNGSATTAMRSDAAPALDVAIVPTWTGTHTFSASATIFGSAANALNVIQIVPPAASGANMIDLFSDGGPGYNSIRKYFSSPFQVEIASSGSIDFVIDSNGNETGATVKFLTNALRGGAQTTLFTFNDNGSLVFTPTAANAIKIDPFGAAAGNTSEIRFLELAAGGTNYTGFKAADAMAASEIYVLPDAAPSANRFLRAGAVAAGVSALTWAQVSLTADVTGILPVANGGSGTSTAFTQGSVIFAGAAGVFAQDNASFFWDDTNNRLGIGMAVPTAQLQIKQTSGADSNAIVSLDTTVSGTARGGFQIYRGAGGAMTKQAMFVLAGGTDAFLVGTVASDLLIGASSSQNIIFGNVQTGTTEYMRIASSGNVGIGVTPPLSRLHVTNSVAATVAVIVKAAAAQSGNLTEWQDSSAVILTKVNSAGNVGVRMAATALTAYLHIAAGTATAGTGPLKFTSGPVLTSPEVGVFGFDTDDVFFTITTGTARKRFLFADATAGLTSGRVPFATTNGRLLDDADMTFATDTLTVTNVTISSGGVLQLGNAAAAGAALVSTHTVTVKDSTGTTYRLMALV